MGLANLYNVPGTESEMATWSFIHMAHHRDMINQVYMKYGLPLNEYAIDPFSDSGLYQHQQMHDDLNSILGVAGYDLSDVDWRDQNERAAWIYLNADLHMQVAGVLGVY